MGSSQFSGQVSRYLGEGACASSCGCCPLGRVVAGTFTQQLCLFWTQRLSSTIAYALIKVFLFLCILLLSCFVHACPWGNSITCHCSPTGLSVCHPNIVGGTLDDRTGDHKLDMTICSLIGQGVAKFTLKSYEWDRNSTSPFVLSLYVVYYLLLRPQCYNLLHIWHLSTWQPRWFSCCVWYITFRLSITYLIQYWLHTPC